MGPIDVTELGIVTDVNPVQYWNAYLPIVVTESGIVLFLQPAINVFVDVSIIALQLLRESYILFPDSTLISVKLEHPANTPSPISVTESGIVTDVNPVQYSNALFPIVVTELGMVIDVKLLHPSYACWPIEVTV